MPHPTLNPCPFCGEDVDIGYLESEQYDVVCVECINCGASGPWFEGKRGSSLLLNMAKEAWNKRAPNKVGNPYKEEIIPMY